MTRYLILVVLAMTVLSCTIRKPTMRAAVAAEYQRSDRAEIMENLQKILETENIPVVRNDRQSGVIASDSFEVAPADCDCGMNFFGAEYPGTRRGKLRIVVSGSAPTQIKFEFAALLTITANQRQVKCTSFGLLEERILTELEKRLGMARINAQP